MAVITALAWATAFSPPVRSGVNVLAGKEVVPLPNSAELEVTEDVLTEILLPPAPGLTA